MKTAALALLVIAPFVFSCAALKPGIPMHEVPAGPLVRALGQRTGSFSSLRAAASLEAVRKDRRRVFDNAAVLVRGHDRLRIEAYGPLGQTIVTLLWTGQDVTLEYEGTRRVMPAGESGLDRILGSNVDPADLTDILAGNVPGMARVTSAKLLCPEIGGCVLELGSRDRRIRVHPDPAWESKGALVRSCEVLDKGSFAYQVRYESFQDVSGYLLPKTIVVENPGKRVALTVRYSDAEVNVPLDEQAFELAGGER